MYDVYITVLYNIRKDLEKSGDIMNVVAIGATGGTGNQLTRQLLEEGHTVTVFVRSPDKLGDLTSRVNVVQGDARNIEALERAVANQDAVLSALGPRSFGKDDLQETYLTNLVSAMDSQGIKRLINLSALGAGESASKAPLPMKILAKTFLKNMMQDKDKGEAAIAASDLEFTNVRPGRLGDGPALGNVDGNEDGQGLSRAIARADVAAFMIKQLSDQTWVRKSPIIGYGQ